MYNQITSNKRRTAVLIALFVALIAVLGWFFGEITNYGYGMLAGAVIFSALMSLFSYYSGDKVALASSGAKPVQKADNPYLYRMVENLCIASGTPLPKIHIINDSAINAFATGRDPEHASIAVTSGAIEKLENEELEGVIAHELSHIKNYDIRLMMIIVVLLGTAVLLSDWMMRARLFGNRSNNDRENGNFGAILLIAGIIFAVLSPVIAQIIQLAISRKREFLADASGALITRYPEGLANALRKISADGKPLGRATNATAHLFIANPFGREKKFLANLFATHPPVEERIKELKKMAV